MGVTAELLTDRQEAFVAAYVGRANLHPVEAARIAGYSSPHPEGSRLLRHATVRARIRQILRERAMDADEVIDRLSDLGRASIEDAIDIDPNDGQYFKLNLKKAEERGKLHCLKKVKYDKWGRPEIEVHSPIEALETLAKVHKLFGDTVQLNVTVTEDPAAKLERIRELAAKHGVALLEDPDILEGSFAEESTDAGDSSSS